MITAKKLFLFSFSLFFFIHTYSQTPPKREFRGAWLHVVGDIQYKNMTTSEMRSYCIGVLDELQAMNINAVIFQIRPAADALYYSDLEPWSKYLTGRQGNSPFPFIDPMYFMIEECHKRNMEFHAWLNPYRVTLNNKIDVLASSHLYHKEPERFVNYGNQTFFDPGVPENRAYICNIVKDIIIRYNVDAIHMDDYFYPYPIAGEPFPDDNSFIKYGAPMGYLPNQRADWRRENVNMLIKEIKETITENRPWVRFGISPFGIYQNKKNTADDSGSNTNGLQNYGDLYADIKLWVKNGWIDYNIPQIYWEIGHKAADYETLIRWWSANNYGAHLYIGQDVVRTMNAKDLQSSRKNQLTSKMELAKTTPAVYGNCWWPGYELLNNKGGIADSLKNNYQHYPALIPAYTHLHNKTPKDVKSLKAQWTPEGYKLTWKRNGDIYNPKTAQYFVIYRFENKEKPNLNDVTKIAKITRDTEYFLPYENGKTQYKYIVTSVDKYHNESKKGKEKKVKL